MALETRKRHVIDLPLLRDRPRVFRDRLHAGSLLADLACDLAHGKSIVTALPPGGVPVAAEMARRLGLPLAVAAVCAITPSDDSGIRIGAVAFDGTQYLDEPLISRLRLSDDVVQRAIDTARDTVRRWAERYGCRAATTAWRHRAAILVDDGLAGGLTMRVAAEALRRAGTRTLVVAVPTAHVAALRHIDEAHRIYCANLCSGHRFAIADAYRRWFDVDEDHAVELYRAVSRPSDDLDSPVRRQR